MSKMTQIEKLAQIDKMTASINNKYKKTVCARLGNSEELKEQLKIKFIKLPSEALNDAIGGGLPRKRVTILSGMESSGKTGTLLETIAINQREDETFTALWLESEDSLDPDFMEMLGIDFNRFVLVMHDKDRGAEVCLDESIAMAESGVFDMFVINSIKALVPKVELENSLTKETMALQARMNSKLMRKLGPIISNTDAALVIVNHLTTSLSMMHGDPLVQGGGRALKHWATLTLDFRKLSIQDSDPVDKDSSMKVGAYVRKNRCVFNRNPYVKTDFFIIYGEGTEQVLEVMQSALDKEILQKGGAWIRDIDPATGEPRVLADGTVLKFQGKANFKAFCLENPEYFNELKLRCGGKSYESLSSEEIEEIEKEAIDDEKAFSEMSTLEKAIAEDKKAAKKKK